MTNEEILEIGKEDYNEGAKDVVSIIAISISKNIMEDLILNIEKNLYE